MLTTEFSAYPATQAPVGVQSVGVPQMVPGIQSVGVPQMVPGIQSVGVPQVVQGAQSVIPGTVDLGVQGVVPGLQSVVPVQSVAPGVQSVVQVQSVAPGVQSVVPVQSVMPAMQSVVPGVQSVVPVQSMVPGVQSVVPVQSMVPGVQSVAQQVVPQVQAVPQVTPYVQPLGSRHPIEQNHLGLGISPGGFTNVGGSPYGKVSTIGVPVTSYVTVPGYITRTGYITTTSMANVDPSAYMQHVELLRNACSGTGTDEDTIVRVIASTTNQERALIRRLYTQKYNEDLVARLQSELSGDFKEAAVGSFMTPTEYDAYCLNGAMKGIGTKEGVLTEIIGSRTPQELSAIKQVYAGNYGDVLDNTVASETSGEYQKLLLSLLQCQRSNSPTVDTNGCMNDAAALYQAGEGKWGTDEALFNRVFATRSPAELGVINQYYKQHAGKGLLGAVNNEFSGDTKELLDTIIRSNIDPYGYYAGRIHDSMAGVGTNDSRLIRNICARHAVDMPLIKQAYQRDYGKDMLTDIQGDTSGHYRQVLSSLVANAR